jgi:pyruvate formate-lyase activating enzyme-like uncharacterized protein
MLKSPSCLPNMSEVAPRAKVLPALPPSLAEIEAATKRRGGFPPRLQTQQAVWTAHVNQVGARVPGVQIAGGGEALHLGELSPGCQACKAGQWDCIFTHTACNLNCRFCLQPQIATRRRFGSVFGSSPAAVAVTHARVHITGVSFSGGEPLLDRAGLLDWIRSLNAHDPSKYYWAYTNGLLLQDGDLEQLAQAGLKELRFNLAASGYDNPGVLKRLAEAARILTAVTVEIPAIPEDGPKVLRQLEVWSAAGVRYLNLHELMHEAGTNSAELPGLRIAQLMDDGHTNSVHPFSRALTLAVMEKVAREGLPLHVNDCSMQSKALQVRQRRRALAPLFKQAHEELLGADLLESACACSATEVIWFRLGEIGAMQRHYPDHRFFRVVRKAPLAPSEPPCWTDFEPLLVSRHCLSPQSLP